MPETITKEQFRKEGGGRCPFKDCRSGNVTFDAVLFDKDDGEASQMATCHGCDRSWDEIFTVDRFEVMEESE